MTKTYTEAFKDAVRLVETSGKPKTQVARDLGISESALYRWIKDDGTTQDQPATSNGQAVKDLEAEPSNCDARMRSCGRSATF